METEPLVVDGNGIKDTDKDGRTCLKCVPIVCEETYYSATCGHQMTLLLCTGRTVLHHLCQFVACQQLLHLYSADLVEFFECPVTVSESCSDTRL
ncbi:uncharacterized protein [Anabrus simplex]|uniref:uncharacterized protein n=1 Tax=Anabrus simplex TaxID=316456 RepID=UPI0034DCC507